MPEATLKALADHGHVGPVMAADGGDCETELGRFAKAGVAAILPSNFYGSCSAATRYGQETVPENSGP